ncbi:MAG: glycosyltransferase family 4 protein [Vicinamibacterales bacterium]
MGSHLRAQARAQRALGHDVRVYGPASAPLADPNETVLSGSISVTFSGTESGLGLDPRSAGRITRLFARERFDIVHVHEPLTPLLPWFAVWSSPAPVVGTFHVHREAGHRFYPIGRPLLTLLMRRIACRIAVSEAARRTVERYFPGRYEIVPNGIECDTFRVPRPRPPAMEAGRRHVLFVGRLEPRKGVASLIRAMARVQARAKDVRLLIVGDGPDRARLESLTASTRVDARFTGVVDDDALPGYFQAADVFCSPATGGESFGVVLLEAMACGTPVVATAIEGYQELVGDTGCGSLVAPGDDDALAAAILTLLQDEHARRAAAAAGADRARAFDWQAVARRLEALYLGLARPASGYNERGE